MTPAEYEAYEEAAAAGYAQEKVAAGAWPADKAAQLAREEFAQMLPSGLGTPDNHLFTVREAQSGSRVAHLWLCVRASGSGPQSFVCDIEVDERLRGKGYGRATMLAAAQWTREKGFASMGLHVFGHNETARALYTSLGFVTTDLTMMLPL